MGIKGLLKIGFIIALALIVVTSVIALEKDDSEESSFAGGETKITSDTKEINLQENPDAKGTASPDTPVTIDTTHTGKAGGEIDASGGHLNKVGSWEGDQIGEKAEGAENLYYQGDGVYIDRAKYFECNGVKAVNSQNIYCSPTNVKIGDVETVQNKGMGSTVKNFNSNGNTFSVDSAKVVVIDNTVFTDIGKSTFTTDSQNHLTSVNITSAKDDNSVELKDATIIIDTGESFDALIKPDGSLVVNTNDPAVIKKDAETIITLTNEIPAARKILNETNITEKQVGKSSVDIDSVLGVVAVHMAPTTRYISYVNNTMSQPFAVYAQPLHSYDFYLKKTKDQIVPDINSCLHCGVMDFEKDTVVFHGYFDYERVGTNGKYVKIVQGKAENDVITLFLDRNMNKITDVSATGSRVHMYSGPFEVMSKAA